VELYKGVLMMIGQQYCSCIADWVFPLKTSNINRVCHAPHSLIHICGIACQRMNFITISTKSTQKELEKLIMETSLVVFVTAVVF
jgi:hypothetical protein